MFMQCDDQNAVSESTVLNPVVHASKNSKQSTLLHRRNIDAGRSADVLEEEKAYKKSS